MDFNETLYHNKLTHFGALFCFPFFFVFAEVRQFLVVKKKQRGRSLLSNRRELFLSTVEPLYLGERRKWPLQRGGRCREVKKRVNVWTVRQEKKWPLWIGGR